MSSFPSVTVIIPTITGGLEHLVNLLPGLSQEPDTLIGIVDNNSRDGTANYLVNYDCLVKINRIRMNFSQSNNYIASMTKSEYLLFLNNDTIIKPGLVADLKKTFSLNPDIGAVGTLLVTMDNPKKVQHAGIMFTQDYVPYELGLPVDSITPGITMNDDRTGSVREVPAVTAACMMVKRSIFEQVGGFDEMYVNGWEDTDLNLKIREAGYKIWYNGQTSVRHKHFGSKGRFDFESQNRKRYDDIWVYTGRAKQILNGFREA